MKIFYFSGTGNSFYTAQKISEEIRDSEILSITDIKENTAVEIDDNEVVLVTPLYFYQIPPVVEDFITRLKSDRITYFSVVITAEFPNGIAMKKLDNICLEKKIVLNSCFYLKMPTNYVIKSKMLSKENSKEVIRKSLKKITKISGIINKRGDKKEKDSRLYSLIVKPDEEYADFKESYNKFDDKFTCTDDCNSCGLCQKNCPAGNITVKGKPVWDSQCAACLKCINICPKQAIQYNGKTVGRTRYFNPYIKLSDFK